MKEYVKINKKAYDDSAEEYKSRISEYIVSDRKIAGPFINYLKNNFSKARVLELGPGSGLNLSYFENEGFETYAIDISKNIIDVARKTSPQTRFIYGDFLENDFGNLKFEGIFAKAFIHLFPKNDAISVLKKIYGSLVPSGILFVATTVHAESGEGYVGKIDYKNQPERFRKNWTEEELLHALELTGFSLVDKGYHENRDKKWINLVVKA